MWEDITDHRCGQELGGTFDVRVYPVAHHVQVDVDQTAMQVLVGFDSRGMITVFPERSLPPFALIVFLCGASSDNCSSAESRAGLCPSPEDEYDYLLVAAVSEVQT